jgi:hypothetical protein
MTMQQPKRGDTGDHDFAGTVVQKQNSSDRRTQGGQDLGQKEAQKRENKT